MFHALPDVRKQSAGLNEVRPRRPEQYYLGAAHPTPHWGVSMKSGLEGRNNKTRVPRKAAPPRVSMKSGLEGRNNLTFMGITSVDETSQ